VRQAEKALGEAGVCVGYESCARKEHTGLTNVSA